LAIDLPFGDMRATTGATDRLGSQAMPFVVQCPYCKMRARVPDRALGASGKCARCASSFTLVPADDQRVPEMAAARSDLEPTAEVSVSAGNAEQDAAHAELMAQFDAAPIDADISGPHAGSNRSSG
jgi:DNA-directed RNA polymerase subunit RPC12/RpoP